MNHLLFTKSFWKMHLRPEDIAVDATCGNGYDTLFLSELCTVIGLDIQVNAIKNTENLLAKHGKRAVLHRMNHREIDSLTFSNQPRLVVYNLGYLPGGDKSLTTLTETTLESVKKSLQILSDDGALSITCYPGHEEGKIEEKILYEWAQSLEKERWFVLFFKFLNRDRAPSTLWIQSSGKSEGL